LSLIDVVLILRFERRISAQLVLGLFGAMPPHVTELSNAHVLPGLHLFLTLGNHRKVRLGEPSILEGSFFDALEIGLRDSIGYWILTVQ
jgi:hypothetical protein